MPPLLDYLATCIFNLTSRQLSIVILVELAYALMVGKVIGKRQSIYEKLTAITPVIENISNAISEVAARKSKRNPMTIAIIKTQCP